MSRLSTIAVALPLLALSVVGPHCAVADAVPASAGSDARAIELARSVLQHMGGQDAWNGTRFVRWRFFGGRRHYWDRATGDVRIEDVTSRDDPDARYLILMNVDSKAGRVWNNGAELPPGEAREEWLERGHKIWINDSYWMFMPYKLLDPGVTLRYLGERALEDGRPADVLELTFADVGYTPENRYEVLVARDSGLVEQWDFFAQAADEEPRFKMPWSGWKRFGKILLATDHGRDNDWEIAVYDELPAGVFHSPDPVSIE